jgi:hypothetical protein
MFDERNGPGRYEAIHGALEHARPDESPLFRIVDDVTREASLRPVKAGAVVFNLMDRRIITLQNGYQEITRTGRGEVFDGERMTGARFTYRLPKTGPSSRNAGRQAGAPAIQIAMPPKAGAFRACAARGVRRVS